jgi:hypothetical protein
MYSDGGGGNGACVVHSLHSMIGVGKQIWVLGLLSQKEDLSYYLEDSTYSIKVSFNEL